MRTFYRAYPLDAAASIKRPPAVAKLPWAHNVVLLEKVKDPQDRAKILEAEAFDEGAGG